MTVGLSPEHRQRLKRLERELTRLGSVLVAWSGGVDSSLVAYVAARTLGAKALAVTSASASLKRRDLQLTERLAVEWGLAHRVILTDELGRAEYRANPVDRCFYCKTALYQALAELARDEGYAHIVNGANTDDLGDHRPGLAAAQDFHVCSPLVNANIDKACVRALAAHLGLANADKPQAACLSSRFPYGARIDRARLAQVEAAEEVLARLGFRDYRVRHHETVARLEVGADELSRALAEREALEAGIRACGYQFVALDLGGFRSGSLNVGVIPVRAVDADA